MKSSIDSNKIEKKDFLELYENAKRGKIDLYQLPKATLEKICALLEEEIKIKEKDIEIIKTKIKRKNQEN